MMTCTYATACCYLSASSARCACVETSSVARFGVDVYAFSLVSDRVLVGRSPIDLRILAEGRVIVHVSRP